MKKLILKLYLKEGDDMSWGSYNLMKCKKCGNIYEVDEGTLTNSLSEYNKCPICHSEGLLIAHRSMSDVIDEHHSKFQKRKKRALL